MEQHANNDQLELFVNLATNKINQQLKAYDNFSEGIYRILVNLEQVKGAVKNGDGIFFQNLNANIVTIERVCKEIKNTLDSYSSLKYKIDNFFDVNDISLKKIKDELDVLSALFNTLSENFEDIKEATEEIFEIKETILGMNNTLNKLSELSTTFTDMQSKLNSLINSIDINNKSHNEKLTDIHFILSEFKTDKTNFLVWKSKVFFSLFILTPAISFLLLLQQIGLLNIKITLAQ